MSTALVTVERAAAERGVSTGRIRQLLLQGRVEGAVKLGKQWVIPTPVVILPPVMDSAAAFTVDAIVLPQAPQDPAYQQKPGMGTRSDRKEQGLDR